MSLDQTFASYARETRNHIAEWESELSSIQNDRPISPLPTNEAANARVTELNTRVLIAVYRELRALNAP